MDNVVPLRVWTKRFSVDEADASRYRDANHTRWPIAPCRAESLLERLADHGKSELDAAVLAMAFEQFSTTHYSTTRRFETIREKLAQINRLAHEILSEQSRTVEQSTESMDRASVDALLSHAQPMVERWTRETSLLHQKTAAPVAAGMIFRGEGAGRTSKKHREPALDIIVTFWREDQGWKDEAIAAALSYFRADGFRSDDLGALKKRIYKRRADLKKSQQNR